LKTVKVQGREEIKREARWMTFLKPEIVIGMKDKSMTFVTPKAALN
jgi:hypothetical protein